MTVQQLNTAEPEAAREALLRCCGSRQWVDGLLAQRPFRSSGELFGVAESVWWALGPHDWLDAFSAHPQIADHKNSTDKMSHWSSEEQSGVDRASLETVNQFAKGNQEYEQRFGWIFLVNATGKSAVEMLHILESRLKHDGAEELRIAAGEQATITRLRLNKLLDE